MLHFFRKSESSVEKVAAINPAGDSVCLTSFIFPTYAAWMFRTMKTIIGLSPLAV
jgi:hypothetical protein